MSRTLIPRAYIAFATSLEPVATSWLTLLIQAVDPRLPLADQPVLEAAFPVARNLELEGALLALHRLAAHTVPPVRLNQRGHLTVLVAQMLGQLRAQHPLHQRLPRILHQATLGHQILRPLAASQQLVQYRVVDLLRQGPRCPFLSAWTGKPVHRRPDTPDPKAGRLGSSGLFVARCVANLANISILAAIGFCRIDKNPSLNLRRRLSGQTLSDFVAANVGEDGSCENVSEYIRDLIRPDKERAEAEAVSRLKAELSHAFAAPEDSYQPLTAAEVIARNRT